MPGHSILIKNGPELLSDYEPKISRFVAPLLSQIKLRGVADDKRECDTSCELKM
jgi:hypothetical protein